MKRYNILFLCTHNSARSVLGEALASTHPSKKFVGYSAGSTPGGKVNPFAAQIAKELGYPESQLRSKSWDEFSLPDAPKMDFIVTVCDNAAGEVCPFWPGQQGAYEFRPDVRKARRLGIAHGRVLSLLPTRCAANLKMRELLLCLRCK